MANLSEQLCEAVASGKEKEVRAVCGRLAKGGKFKPAGDLPPGNRVFLDKTYMRFTQMSSRQAALYTSAEQGWVVDNPADVLRVLYGDTPVVAAPPPPPAREPEQEAPEEPEAEESEEAEDPLGEPEVTTHGPRGIEKE
jgi:hypothetical protein